MIVKIHAFLWVWAMSVSICLAQNEETRALNSFKQIKVGQAINVYLNQGETEEAKVKCEGIGTEQVATQIDGNTLKIFLKGNNRWFKRAKVDVFVTFRKLEGVNVSSAADVYANDVIVAENLKVVVSSAGDFKGEVEVEKLQVTVSSSGDARISGSANHMNATASSAGDINGTDLVCQTVNAKASSAGDISFQVQDKINAVASSGGSIRYRGDPSQSETVSKSGGSVRKR